MWWRHEPGFVRYCVVALLRLSMQDRGQSIHRTRLDRDPHVENGLAWIGALTAARGRTPLFRQPTMRGGWPRAKIWGRPQGNQIA